jgi:hypothetical protein
MGASVVSLIEWRKERRRRERQAKVISAIVHQVIEQLGPEALGDPGAELVVRDLVAERLIGRADFSGEVWDGDDGGQAA